jgi:hypothetical protein
VIVLLKISCFSIWLLIMYLIITAVLRKQRIPVQNFGRKLGGNGDKNPKFYSRREKT